MSTKLRITDMTVQDDLRLSMGPFRDAMRHLASGVSLVTARGNDGVLQGMLATAVCSVTADPPTLLVCVNRTATMHDDLLASGNFCVNLLGSQHFELSRRFSSPEARASRFETGNWTRLETGAPVLENALAAMDCTLDKALEVATHTVLFGRVEAVRVDPLRSTEPLVYYNRQYGGWAELRP